MKGCSTYQSGNQCDTLAGSRDRLQWLISGSSGLKSGHPCRGASFSTIHNDLNETFAPLKCVTPVCIPNFQQKEAVRDIKRLCETIALYEGCIFAPLKCVSPADPSRGDTFEFKGKGDNPCRSAIPSTDPSPAAPAYRSRRGVAPEGSSLFRPGVEARSAEDPGNEDLGKDIRPR